MRFKCVIHVFNEYTCDNFLFLRQFLYILSLEYFIQTTKTSSKRIKKNSYAHKKLQFHKVVTSQRILKFNKDIEFPSIAWPYHLGFLGGNNFPVFLFILVTIFALWNQNLDRSAHIRQIYVIHIRAYGVQIFDANAEPLATQLGDI